MTGHWTNNEGLSIQTKGQTKTEKFRSLDMTLLDEWVNPRRILLLISAAARDSSGLTSDTAQLFLPLGRQLLLTHQAGLEGKH